MFRLIAKSGKNASGRFDASSSYSFTARSVANNDSSCFPNSLYRTPRLLFRRARSAPSSPSSKPARRISYTRTESSRKLTVTLGTRPSRARTIATYSTPLSASASICPRLLCAVCSVNASAASKAASARPLTSSPSNARAALAPTSPIPSSWPTPIRPSTVNTCAQRRGSMPVSTLANHASGCPMRSMTPHSSASATRSGSIDTTHARARASSGAGYKSCISSTMHPASEIPSASITAGRSSRAQLPRATIAAATWRASPSTRLRHSRSVGERPK